MSKQSEVGADRIKGTQAEQSAKIAHTTQAELDHYGLVPKAEPAKSVANGSKEPAKMWRNSENRLQKCELEARIDELNRLISITRINGEQVINQATYSLASDRIAELSQTLKNES